MSDVLTTPPAIFGFCILAYVILGNAVWRWRENRAHERLSVECKLLRGPGESLQRRIAAIDDRLFSSLLCMIIPPLVFLTGILISSHVSEQSALDKFFSDFVLRGLALPLVFAGLVYYAVRILRLLARRRNIYLGYFGERIVSENIEPLRAKGALIFHDVPVAAGTGGHVNIDHVVVCPGGIFAIETKTRRKGRVRPGFVDGKVTFDGTRLIYPWGEDAHGLGQAGGRAMWLEKHINAALGVNDTVAHAILAFPGWRVEQAGRASGSAVRVLSPGQIFAHIESYPPALAPEQIIRVARELEKLCRDVEF